MNKEEKKLLEESASVMRRMSEAFEAQTKQRAEKPPILFGCWCEWCLKETVHRSCLQEPADQIAASARISQITLIRLHICLACGNIKYKED